MTGSQFLLLVIVGSIAASFGMAFSRYLRKRRGRNGTAVMRKRTDHSQKR